ncbi:MAG: hypothetical protein AAGF07_04180 [Patescibacteria group bacterium]
MASYSTILYYWDDFLNKNKENGLEEDELTDYQKAYLGKLGLEETYFEDRKFDIHFDGFTHTTIDKNEFHFPSQGCIGLSFNNIRYVSHPDTENNVLFAFSICEDVYIADSRFRRFKLSSLFIDVTFVI